MSLFSSWGQIGPNLDHGWSPHRVALSPQDGTWSSTLTSPSRVFFDLFSVKNVFLTSYDPSIGIVTSESGTFPMEPVKQSRVVDGNLTTSSFLLNFVSPIISMTSFVKDPFLNLEKFQIVNVWEFLTVELEPEVSVWKISWQRKWHYLIIVFPIIHLCWYSLL